MKKTPDFTLQMTLNVQFDRAIDRDRHHIMPGGYEMVFNGKTVNFDFCTIEAWIDDHDPTVLLAEMSDFDDECYDLEGIEPEDFGKLEKLNEVYIYTGEKSEDPEINPVKLMGLSFEVYDQKDVTVTTYDYSDSAIVRNFKFS